MSASPNKRPRLAGSFSPASPPYHLAKTADQKSTTVQPNTPTSPPYMSTIPSAHGDTSSAFANQRSAASPPSATTLSQFSQTQATSYTFPTPASSTAGTASFAQARDGDGDTMMGDDYSVDALKSLDRDRSASDGWAAHRRTDHDRQGEKASAAAQKAMDSYPFVCQKPTPPSSPWHVSINTLHAYGLDSLANSVRRHDPVTGQKINKLRKTYKAVLQDLKLPGRTEPVVQKDQFNDMYRMSDELWQSQVVGNHNLSEGFNGLLANLDKALKMDAVKLPPEAEKDVRKVIGADDAKKKLKMGEVMVKKPGHSAVATPSAASSAVSGGPNAVQPSNAPSPAMRPSRPGTKRRYNDASFKGYGEGYADDDLADTTAGEEEGRAGASKKKRRKENFSAAGSILAPPASYNNVGMVGVRR